MTSVRIGLDVGTTSIKAAAYDAAGRMLAQAAAASPVSSAKGGLSQQDMDTVWGVVCTVLSRTVAKLADLNISSLGVSAQGDGLWAIQADGTPAGPALLWNDTRAAADVVELLRSQKANAVAHACHTSLWPGTSGALWRWLSKHDPEMQARTKYVFTCGDWIGWKLTGIAATDYSNASIPFLDLTERRYSKAALEALDCGDLHDRLLEPRAAASQLGTVTSEAAQATGLPEGLSVSVPTLDLAAMIVGMGMDQPGQTMMIMGTTAVVNILAKSVEPSDLPVGATALHPTSDAIIRIMAPTTGAAAFDWFAALHPLSLGGETSGEVAQKLNELICDIPPGANGVTFLPYLNGERAPFVSPDVTASFYGLTSVSTKADMGRAVLEGGAMSLRHCFVEEGGLPSQPVQLTGGGAKNGLWCQIIADMLGVPVLVSQASDQGLWGAASIGAAAAGLGDVMSLTARDEATTTYEPDMKAHQAYGPVFARYVALSENARMIAEKLKNIGERI